MTATVTGGAAPAGPAVVPSGPRAGHARRRDPRRRRTRLFRASTTPGKVRLIQAGLVVMCLGWGALAALMVGQHASAANDMSAVSEPLSLDAQQIYQSLADADVTVSTGYLFGRTAPFDYRQR